jgi:benzil reductase ((S)-benzoin forming)
MLAISPGAVATPMLEQLPKRDEQDFPAVGKFRELLASGRAGGVLARGIWGLLDRDFDSGAIIDVRKWL